MYCTPYPTPCASPTAAASTLVTVDLGKGVVTSNISYTNPILAAHFADCKAQRVGGLTIQVPRPATAGQLRALSAHPPPWPAAPAAAERRDKGRRRGLAQRRRLLHSL